MDQINTDSGALSNVTNILNSLDLSIEKLTSKTVNTINQQLNGIDEEFRKDIKSYIKEIKNFQIKLQILMDSTKSSLEIRKNIVETYTMSNYIKRNI